MKKTIKSMALVMLALILTISIFSCNKEEETTGLWATATYKENTTVGEGEKVVLIDVETEEKTITLTVKTDKSKLGDALYELSLINDATFFDTLNGIKASWENDSAYWAFYKGDEFMSCGVNDTDISGGEHFRFVYTRL